MPRKFALSVWTVNTFVANSKQRNQIACQNECTQWQRPSLRTPSQYCLHPSSPRELGSQPQNTHYKKHRGQPFSKPTRTPLHCGHRSQSPNHKIVPPNSQLSFHALGHHSHPQLSLRIMSPRTHESSRTLSSKHALRPFPQSCAHSTITCVPSHLGPTPAYYPSIRRQAQQQLASTTRRNVSCHRHVVGNLR